MSRARARARLWARKESALKAVSTGLDVDPASFAAPLPGVLTPVGPDRVTVVVADLDDALEQADLPDLPRLDDAPGRVGAVALARPDASVPVVLLGGRPAGVAWPPASGQTVQTGQTG